MFTKKSFYFFGSFLALSKFSHSAPSESTDINRVLDHGCFCIDFDPRKDSLNSALYNSAFSNSIKTPVIPRACDADCGILKRVGFKEIENEAEEAYKHLKIHYIDMASKTNKLKENNCDTIVGEKGNELTCNFEGEEKVTEFNEAIADKNETYGYFHVIIDHINIILRMNEGEENTNLIESQPSYNKYSKYLKFQYKESSLKKKITTMYLLIQSEREVTDCNNFNKYRKNRLNKDYSAIELELKNKIKSSVYYYINDRGFCDEYWYYRRDIFEYKNLDGVKHKFNDIALEYIQHLSNYTATL
ncbi:hypothetical protein AYI69_g4413 [Smittium culicis]|uniref:Uncharacterized protein n=1 Tax=Smittium culicis TaxID=133412 RepID=A0A1R1YDS6_9FUNG|nr:hypothetical protein AYI69_g11396 [Smittium culicis]OMJ25078.1 hypothetical protein AYI69_g4413 [Smittium culicis]